MANAHKDRTGQRFGKLTLLRLAEPRAFPCGKTQTQWLCRCDCGQEKVYPVARLMCGDAKTCGQCRPTIEERFWSFVDRGGPDECWPWKGYRNLDGYGVFYTENEQDKAHRYSLHLKLGGIPAGLHALHTCDTPACVNPNHLYAGTHQQNMQDMFGRKPPVWRKGPDAPDAKLTWQQVREIRTSYGCGRITQVKLAQAYGVSPGAISNIVLNKTYREPA